MKKQISLCSILIWIATCSFEHSKQIVTVLGVAAPVVANAQFTQTYSFPDSACLYFGNFKGKLLASQKDSIGLSNPDYYKIFSPFYLPSVKTLTTTATKALYIDPTTKEVMQGGLPVSASSTSITSTSTLITVSGSAPNYSITARRQQTYNGTTSAAGSYTVSFGTAYPSIPNVVPGIIGDFPSYTAVVSAVSTTGFTVKVYTLSSILLTGLVPQYSAVPSVPVNVIVTQN